MISAALRQCLIDLDVSGVRALARETWPLVPQPKGDEGFTVGIHQMRTREQTVPPKYRYYSHCWLTERGLPSQLPDRLKQSAERMYPKVVDSVGVAVRSKVQEIKDAIEGRMVYAVEDCYANGDRDPSIVKPQMMAARAQERKALGLKLVSA